jgi:hypothetical protein
VLSLLTCRSVTIMRARPHLLDFQVSAHPFHHFILYLGVMPRPDTRRNPPTPNANRNLSNSLPHPQPSYRVRHTTPQMT